jgi:hypothetical protein
VTVQGCGRSGRDQVCIGLAVRRLFYAPVADVLQVACSNCGKFCGNVGWEPVGVAGGAPRFLYRLMSRGRCRLLRIGIQRSSGRRFASHFRGLRSWLPARIEPPAFPRRSVVRLRTRSIRPPSFRWDVFHPTVRLLPDLPTSELFRGRQVRRFPRLASASCLLVWRWGICRSARPLACKPPSFCCRWHRSRSWQRPATPGASCGTNRPGPRPSLSSCTGDFQTQRKTAK